MAWQEVPLFARIIHLADVIDAIANNIKCRQEKWDKCCEFLVKQKGLLFDDECVEAFFEMISKETFVSLEDGSFESKLWEIVPRKKHFRFRHIIDDIIESLDGIHHLVILGSYLGFHGIWIRPHSIQNLREKMGKMGGSNFNG